MKKKNLGFTLAEVLIVIGIIGVVAALTLPNLNHATGDKETVTRFKKIYSSLSDAHDRAVAIYGPLSSWETDGEGPCNDLPYCWINRIGEFIKISKSCDITKDISCDQFWKGDMPTLGIIYQLSDGSTISMPMSGDFSCDWESSPGITDTCLDEIYFDVNGPNKGKNKYGQDIFRFYVSDSIGLYVGKPVNIFTPVQNCLMDKDDYSCSWWVFENENLDYLKADENGVCPNGTQLSETQTSCN